MHLKIELFSNNRGSMSTTFTYDVCKEEFIHMKVIIILQLI